MPTGRYPKVIAQGLALASVLTSGVAAAQMTDLMDTFDLALYNDPTYLSAGASNRASQELTPQARALLLPNINLDASSFGNRQTVQEGVQPPKKTFNTRDLNLNITQPIYRGDLWIQLDQADLRVKQADVQFAFAKQDLMLRVALGYFDVLRAMDELEFAQSTKESVAKQLEQSKQRFEVGLIAITDVQESQAGFDTAVAQTILRENQLDNAREALREITGQYHRDLAVLGPDMPLVAPEPNDIDAWTRTALGQNLNVRASELSAAVAEEEIRRVEAGHLPTLDLVGTHNRRKSGGITLTPKTHQTSIGIQLSVPIYQGGLVVSQTREALELHRQALDDMEAQRRATQRQAREAFLGVLSGISQVRAFQQAVVSNESALEATEAGFQVGTRTAVDVLNAEAALFGAKRDLAGARYDYIVNIVSLKQAAGTLSEEDLQEIDSWLRR